MADPYVREIGAVENDMGERISVGVDGSEVGIFMGAFLSADGINLGQDQAEEFGRLYVSACWQAGENKRCMREEVHEADGGDSMEGCDAVGIKDGTGYECTELGPHRVHLARAADPEHGEIVHAWDAR